jgi:hypothetical protein
MPAGHSPAKAAQSTRARLPVGGRALSHTIYMPAADRTRRARS